MKTLDYHQHNIIRGAWYTGSVCIITARRCHTKNVRAVGAGLSRTAAAPADCSSIAGYVTDNKQEDTSCSAILRSIQ